MTTAQGAAPPLPCPPGTKMLLEVAGLPDKLTTACVGQAKGRFVVTHLPVVPETNRDALYQMLYPDNTVIVRFLHGGTVMGFSSSVIKAVQIPFPLLFLAYPALLESHDLRRHPRVPCCIPAETSLGETRALGMITDLSRTGCQFAAPLGADRLPEPRVDDRITLSCALFGTPGQTQLPAAVKRVNVSDHRLDIGLKFATLPAQTRSALDEFLQHALSVLD